MPHGFFALGRGAGRFLLWQGPDLGMRGEVLLGGGLQFYFGSVEGSQQLRGERQQLRVFVAGWAESFVEVAHRPRGQRTKQGKAQLTSRASCEEY